MNPSVTRSLARVVAAALPDFQIGASGDAGSYQRPFAAVILAATTSTPHGSAYADVRSSYSIISYPSEGINADGSKSEADRVQRALWMALAAGNGTHPHRLPLWSYETVGLFEPGPVARIGYVRVVDAPAFSSFTGPDGSWVVTCDLRLSLVERIAPAAAGPVTVAVGARKAA